MEETKKAYLGRVLDSYRMSHIDDLVDKYKTRRDEVKEEIEGKYSSDVYSPKNSGSFAKHTAINSKFDLDLVVPYKRNSFSTLEVMFDDLYDFLLDKYSSVAEVRKQKVSIGLNFYPDDDGESVCLDIVPGRELNQDQYIEDKNLNLYVNSQYGLLDEKSRIQTNIQSQIDHIKAKENERKVIRLFKIWKTSNNEKYKSFLLELIVIKAFEKSEITGSLWQQLKAVMSYVEHNISKTGFTLKDPGNAGNNVVDTLDEYERDNLSNSMKRMVDNIDAYKADIKNYFPTNSEFEVNEDDSSQSGYGKKSGSVISTPPDTTRFG